MILFAAMTLMACGSDNKKQESKDNKEAPAANESAEVAGKDGQVTYRPDTAMVFYDGKVDPNKAFIVISKKELRLFSFGKDSLLGRLGFPMLDMKEVGIQ